VPYKNQTVRKTKQYYISELYNIARAQKSWTLYFPPMKCSTKSQCSSLK